MAASTVDRQDTALSTSVDVPEAAINTPSVNDVPSIDMLEQTAEIPVFSADGASHSFSSIYAERPTLVIFLRHFFCGVCQEYVRDVCAQIQPDELAACNKAIVFIGCGQPSLIKLYNEETSCSFPVYAEPTRALYEKLGMIQTLALGNKPEYMKSSLIGLSLASIVQAVKSGSGAFKGGNIQQIGGEFLIEPGNKCTWAHRMTTTRDHAPVSGLKKALKFVSCE
ncbi:unnamed protein product [Didymodactylos carnosus]|uniref:Uncharacterized protein n=1 Tax=Didymodactylos carnosus TaxID=1234261 RepID=A0A814LJ19_9BILA|nr:unnamed protein product [Didymodactylos carnosus]CAF1176813.1 unnamed protein product [Didymodactylos carnosus]CAF3833371.1 unnamed protein product [Didymodactylos carnosus]CAF3988098.1 unnamed protein product [Didymodactylos carnosus]